MTELHNVALIVTAVALVVLTWRTWARPKAPALLVAIRAGPRDDCSAGPSNSGSQRSGRGRSSPLRVLVADDEPLLRQLLQDVLEAAGHEVIAVGDGEQAIQALRRKTFDVVVTDLAMPRQDGRDVLRAAKALRRRPRVIVITGHANGRVEPELLLLGAERVMRKPFELGALLANLAPSS